MKPEIKLGDTARNHWTLQTVEAGKVVLHQPEAKLARQNQEKLAGIMESARVAGGSPLWGKSPKGSCSVPEPFVP